MAWAIALLLMGLWLLAILNSYTMGGFIHLLLILGVIIIIVHVIQNKTPNE